MKISTRSRYGLRAMVYLAGHDPGPVPLSEIAREESIPAAFLERILGRLRAAGLLCTTRGVAGGYELARAASAITANDVVEAVEGEQHLVDCLADGSSCERAESCSSQVVWRRLDEAIAGALSEVTLDQLVREEIRR
jgi:Rrf2 family protein